MKKFTSFIIALFICSIAFAQTINWYVDNQVYQTTTCENGSNVTPPTPPEKYGYHFVQWNKYSKRLEYLESTGTQAIDTGIVFSQSNAKVVIKFAATKSESTCLSGAESPHTFIATFRDDKTCIWHATNNIRDSLCTPMAVNTVYTLEMFQHDGIFEKTVNGITQYANNTPGYTNKSFSLFSDNYGNGNYTQKSNARIFYTKIYENGVLVRDMIPVLDFNGVPCMFDEVSQTFFYNKGTGNFIAGPIVKE